MNQKERIEMKKTVCAECMTPYVMYVPYEPNLCADTDKAVSM